jgi:hypothetical protein
MNETSTIICTKVVDTRIDKGSFFFYDKQMKK